MTEIKIADVVKEEPDWKTKTVNELLIEAQKDPNYWYNHFRYNGFINPPKTKEQRENATEYHKLSISKGAANIWIFPLHESLASLYVDYGVISGFGMPVPLYKDYHPHKIVSEQEYKTNPAYYISGSDYAEGQKESYYRSEGFRRGYNNALDAQLNNLSVGADTKLLGAGLEIIASSAMDLPIAAASNLLKLGVKGAYKISKPFVHGAYRAVKPVMGEGLSAAGNNVSGVFNAVDKAAQITEGIYDNLHDSLIPKLIKDMLSGEETTKEDVAAAATARFIMLSLRLRSFRPDTAGVGDASFWDALGNVATDHAESQVEGLTKGVYNIFKSDD